MKKLLLLALLIPALTMQAQLLKRLKEKAKQVIEPDKKSQPASPATTAEETSSANTNNKVKQKWTPTPDAQKLFTLAAGETFFYDETRVIAKNGKLSYAFVVGNSKYEYFLVEDGKRSGPFKEPPVTMLQARVEKSEEEDAGSNDGDDEERIEMGSEKKDPVALQYSKTINNKLYIVFNGKNYGPYDFVGKMRVSADKKKFWAAVVSGGATEMLAKMGMGNVYLVNEGAIKQKGGSESSFPAKLLVSNNFTAAAITIVDNAGQKAITVSSSGKQQEGSMMDISSGQKSFMSVADNGDIIAIPSQSPTQLMVNGNEAASFAVPITSIRRLFLMPGYKKSVYYQSGKLYRGDGSVEALTGVTFPKFVNLGNEQSIYYYKIHETDDGNKDIYLCKKVL